MNRYFNLLLSLALACAMAGCASEDDPTTPDAEPALPEIEIGDETPDLDPRTDHDIDIDTPAPGDR